MVDIAVVVLVLLAVTGLGWVVLRKRIGDLVGRAEFAGEYMKRFRGYVESRGDDGQAYAWLTHRANKMQNDMGGHGVMKHFRPPFANYMFNDYPIVLNMLPEVRTHIGDPVMHSHCTHYIDALQEAFLRYIGALDDAIEHAQSDLRNPVVAFRQGVQALLLAPRYLFHWLGLATKPSLYSRGVLVTIMTGIVALITLLSGIVTITVGWEEFSVIVMRFLGR